LALLAATILNTLLPDPGAESVTGVKVAVIPLGNPVTEKPTAALNPPLTVTVSVMLWFEITPAPAVTEIELAEARV
jgi:hypothetical protein